MKFQVCILFLFHDQIYWCFSLIYQSPHLYLLGHIKYCLDHPIVQISARWKDRTRHILKSDQ